MDNSNITKCKLFFSLDKELEFINKMNREGWKLVYIKCGCFYTFEKTEPDEYFTVLHATAKEGFGAVFFCGSVRLSADTAYNGRLWRPAVSYWQKG